MILLIHDRTFSTEFHDFFSNYSRKGVNNRSRVQQLAPWFVCYESLEALIRTGAVFIVYTNHRPTLTGDWGGCIS